MTNVYLQFIYKLTFTKNESANICFIYDNCFDKQKCQYPQASIK